ncbi:succinylglutamate desuccinylase/aspartoacylase family protein [Fulvivirgaceae bacterium BMA12]|uniref:Succinylglutamate desuccinylase/aspartoacylase family protein n=1 Tax=Agaribacillus aureus TaxID=3051825 RepID=A0ABT8L6H4_9BACT|nr:succinylglutamate desuccinylase/aspartoacylase family protein [Fulvivirgaceae bacterium BMA12]
MMKDIYPVLTELNINKFENNTINKAWIHLTEDGIGRPILIPVIVARGKQKGPVLGLSAVVHGNELNGIKVIHKLFSQINIADLSGTIVGVPIVNMPSVLLLKRMFTDNVDLNRIMPGKTDGNESEIYTHRLLDRIFRRFEYLIDLHTASFGRINSYYIRVNPKSDSAMKMAQLQNAQIILHSKRVDGTLRGAVLEMGINAITVEVGDPNTFQKGMIRSGLTGIYNLISYLGMLEEEIEESQQESIICKKSKWLYTDQGGILEVYPKLLEIVEKGATIARLSNAFGELIKEYHAPYEGVIIGKSTMPIGQTGSRIIHLGKMM